MASNIFMCVTKKINFILVEFNFQPLHNSGQ